MALQDSYNTGDDTHANLHTINWYAQSFIASSDYSIASIKLKLYRSGDPGIATVSLRAVDGLHKPTGSDIDSVTGTTDGGTLTTDSPGEWREIALSGSISLTSGVEYAIVLRSSSDMLYWRADSNSSYNGVLSYSTDSGGSWVTTGVAAYDFMFETYSAAWPTGTIAGISGQTGALTFDTTGLIGNAAGVSSESGILTFASLGLTGSVAGAGGGSGILSFEALAITGTIAAVAALSGGMLFGNIIKPSTTVTVNRLIVAGNDQIWYESI